MTVICDYSFARPNLTTLKTAGYAGVMRYLAPLPNGKVINSTERQAILSTGLSLGYVWETFAQAASLGAMQGSQEAKACLTLLESIGEVTTHPVYFVAEDPNEEPRSDWINIERYFDAVCKMMPNGHLQVGAYGSQALVESLINQGLATYGWQVEGWSSGVSSLCHLYQRNTPTLGVALGQIDEDVVLQADCGMNTPTLSVTIGAPQGNPAGNGTVTTTTTTEEAVQVEEITLQTDNNGNGWTAGPGGTVVAAYVIGYPAISAHGYPSSVPAWKGVDDNGDLFFEGGPVNTGTHTWTIRIITTS